MPVPKRKRSKSRRDKRFANWGIKVKAITKCNNCQEPLLPHQACSACGYYKGIKVLSTKEDRAAKRGEARKEREARRAAKYPDKESSVAEENK